MIRRLCNVHYVGCVFTTNIVFKIISLRPARESVGTVAVFELRVVHRKNIRPLRSYHQYADDTQHYTAVRSSEDTSRLLMRVEEVTRWFLINGLLLNASKTEAIEFGTRQQLVKRSTDTSLKIGDASLAIMDNVKLLGVIFNSTLSMDQQVNAVVKACNFHIHALRHVRSCLTPEAA